MSRAPLYEPLRDFCSKAAEHLERETTKDGLPRTVVRRFEKPAPNETRPVEDSVVDWGALMQRYGTALEALPEYEAAVAALRGDADASRHLDALVGAPGSWAQRVDARSCLRGLLGRALAKRGFPLQDEDFHGAYEELERFFVNDKIAFDCVAPIEGLTIEQDIELGQAHAIVKLTLEQQAELQTEASHWPESFRTGDEPSALVAYIASPKWIAAPGSDEKEPSLWDDHGFTFRLMARQLLIALQLFKAGNVAIRYLRMSPRLWSPVGGGLHREVWSASTRGIRKDSYVLSASEGDVFARFHDELRRKVWSKGALGVAVRRFCMAAERPLGDSADCLEEQLIDLSIALEALLLPKTSSELNYRLALRGAAVLGKTGPERTATFHLLKAAYGARSSVVHGEVLRDRYAVKGEGDLEAWELVRRTREATRSILHVFLDKIGTVSPEKLVAGIDDKILGGFDGSDRELPPNG